jgi:hypothetical protein
MWERVDGGYRVLDLPADALLAASRAAGPAYARYGAAARMPVPMPRPRYPGRGQEDVPDGAGRGGLHAG